MTSYSKHGFSSCLVLIAAVSFLNAGATAAQDALTEQQMHDRLIGKVDAKPPVTAPGVCTTPEAIESNPDCANAVTANRPWSLTGHQVAAPAPVQAKPVAPRVSTRGTAGARHRAPARGDGAVPCDLSQAGDPLALNLCLTFAHNSASLTPTSKVNLDHLASVLSKPDLQARKVRIDGYADASGDARKNLILSDKRARSAVSYLVSKGLASDRLIATGLGATHPIPGHDPLDPVNRRVEARLEN